LIARLEIVVGRRIAAVRNSFEVVVPRMTSALVRTPEPDRAADLGEAGGELVTDSCQIAATVAASGWAKIVRNIVAPS
jgi:hypothetical protein